MSDNLNQEQRSAYTPSITQGDVIMTTSPQVINLADPGVRILATLIDFIIYFLIIIPATLFLAFVIFGFSSDTYSNIGYVNPSDVRNLSSQFGGWGFTLSTTLLSLFIYLIIFIIFPGKVFAGQTIGKKLMRIRICKVDGQQVGFPDILARYAAPLGFRLANLASFVSCVGVILICGAWPIVTIINLVFLFTDTKRQTLYDKISNTIVVKD